MFIELQLDPVRVFSVNMDLVRSVMESRKREGYTTLRFTGGQSVDIYESYNSVMSKVRVAE